MDGTKLQVGMTVYLRPMLNAARRTKEIQECEITKIRNKYFDVQRKDGGLTVTFIVETLRERTNYSPDWELHFDRQEIVDENEHIAIFRQLFKTVTEFPRGDKLTLDQLRRIKVILDEEEPK